jgi:hypothetical protein
MQTRARRFYAWQESFRDKVAAVAAISQLRIISVFSGSAGMTDSMQGELPQHG